MSEIFVDQGLDAILTVFPKNGSNYAFLFLGLFVSQSATTVPARTVTDGSSPSTGWSEVTGTAYGRQGVPAGSWGTPSTNGNGRKITTTGTVTMPTAGNAWGTVNGFFLATASGSLAGSQLVYFANFDDGLSIIVGTNDVIKVTPSVQYDG